MNRDYHHLRILMRSHVCLATACATGAGAAVQEIFVFPFPLLADLYLSEKIDSYGTKWLPLMRNKRHSLPFLLLMISLTTALKESDESALRKTDLDRRRHIVFLIDRTLATLQQRHGHLN